MFACNCCKEDWKSFIYPFSFSICIVSCTFSFLFFISYFFFFMPFYIYFLPMLKGGQIGWNNMTKVRGLTLSITLDIISHYLQRKTCRMYGVASWVAIRMTLPWHSSSNSRVILSLRLPCSPSSIYAVSFDTTRFFDAMVCT